jgi:hypothetical protein
LNFEFQSDCDYRSPGSRTGKDYIRREVNHSSVLRAFVAGQRWLFLAILVYAPWAYGSTPPWAFEVLAKLMAVLVGLWLLGCVLRGTWPKVKGACLVLVTLLLVHGWWMVLNSKAALNPIDSRLTPLAALWPAAPGSIERGLSVASMERFTGLLLIVCYVSDLAQRPIWRTRLWWTIGLTGTSIILFGLFERVARAPMIFWEIGKASDTFFATYLYHANAGAYINLVLPLIAGLAFRVSFTEHKSSFIQAFWTGAGFVALAGAFVNFSRGAQFTTVTIVLVLAIWQALRSTRQSSSARNRWPLYLGLAAIVLLPVGLLWQISTADRWAEIGKATADGRVFAARVTARMIPDAGPLGFGPGTFRIGFPFYITPEEKLHAPEARGYWRYAHDDYLQTAMEWGWIGSVFWVLLFGGGLFRGLRTYLRSQGVLQSADRILLFTSLVALLGIALHALVDFPLQIASLQLYASVYLGLAWGSSEWIKVNRGVRPLPVTSRAGAPIAPLQTSDPSSRSASQSPLNGCAPPAGACSSLPNPLSPPRV